jgi:lactate permease
MFHQLLTPVNDSLGASFCVAALPVVALVLLLGVLRRGAGVRAHLQYRAGGPGAR